MLTDSYLGRRQLLRGALILCGTAAFATSILRGTFAQSRSTEEFVRSADGTRIRYLKVRTGPGLVYAHGSLSTGEEWLRVAELLSGQFTSYVMSRRGHGRSEPGPGHSMDKECEDIDAVLAVAGGAAANLLGHSYGAICAIETARRTEINKLVLYEPPFMLDPDPKSLASYRSDLDAYKADIEADRLEDAMLFGVRRFIQLNEEELAELRRTPVWKEMVAMAPSWVPELEAIGKLPAGVGAYRELAVPTLLLSGTASPDHLHESTAELQRTMPDARVVPLQGQGHEAYAAIPQFMADQIAQFLLSDD